MLALKWAELDLARGRPDAAITRLEPRLATLELGVSPTPRLSPPALLALAYLEKRELTRAGDLADRAVEVARTTESRVEQIDALRIHGMVLARRGNATEAARAFEESLTLSRVMSYPYAEAQTLREWGRLSLREGKPEPARQRLGEAAVILRRLRARRDLAETESALHDLSGGEMSDGR